MKNSKVEVLRIICMIYIIYCHAVSHGIVSELIPYSYEVGFKEVFIQFFTVGGVANSIFILISGFYMINIKKEKIIELMIEMSFYSIIIYVIMLFMRLEVFSYKEFIKVLFPWLYGYNWFVCCYLVLCMFSPFINKIISGMEKKVFRNMLIVLAILTYVMPLLKTVTYMNGEHSLEHFVFIYMIGAYIRLHMDRKDVIYKYSEIICGGAILTTIIIAFTIGTLAIYTSKNTLIYNETYFKSLFGIIIAISAFITIIKMKPFSNKWINTVSSTMLGVYLIHDNPYIRNLIWMKIYPNINLYNNKLFLIELLFKVFCVFIICILIDLIRRGFFYLVKVSLNKNNFNKIQGL